MSLKYTSAEIYGWFCVYKNQNKFNFGKISDEEVETFTRMTIAF